MVLELVLWQAESSSHVAACEEEEEEKEDEGEEEEEEPVEKGRGRSAGRQHLLSPQAARQSSCCFQEEALKLQLHLRCRGTATDPN